MKSKKMPRLIIKRIKMIKRETLKGREREAKRANQRVRQSTSSPLYLHFGPP